MDGARTILGLNFIKVLLIEAEFKVVKSSIRKQKIENILAKNAFNLKETRKMDKEIGKGPKKYLKFEYQLPEVNVYKNIVSKIKVEILINNTTSKLRYELSLTKMLI